MTWSSPTRSARSSGAVDAAKALDRSAPEHGGAGRRDRTGRHRAGAREPALRPGAPPRPDEPLRRRLHRRTGLGRLRLQRQGRRRALVRAAASAPTTCGPPAGSPRATPTATARPWPRSPPVTPGSRSRIGTRAPSAPSAARRRRRSCRSTRPAGARPTPPTTAARPPTWSPPSTRPPPTGSTCSASRSGVPASSTRSSGRCSAPPRPARSSPPPPATPAEARTVAHPGPWVTTVGGTTGDLRRGRVVLPARTAMEGAMLSRRTVGPARVVLAALGARSRRERHRRRGVRARAASTLRASRARSWSARAASVGRVDKSEAVRPRRRRRDGPRQRRARLGRRRRPPGADRAPARAEGRSLVRWVERPPRRRDHARVGRASPAARPAWRRTRRSGDPEGGVLKPDVLAPATGVLGGVPTGDGRRLGLRHRHVGRDRLHRRRGRHAAGSARLDGRRGALGDGDDRRPRRRRHLPGTAAPAGSGPDAAAAAGLGYLVDAARLPVLARGRQDHPQHPLGPAGRHRPDVRAQGDQPRAASRQVHGLGARLPGRGRTSSRPRCGWRRARARRTP